MSWNVARALCQIYLFSATMMTGNDPFSCKGNCTDSTSTIIRDRVYQDTYWAAHRQGYRVTNLHREISLSMCSWAQAIDDMMFLSASNSSLKWQDISSGIEVHHHKMMHSDLPWQKKLTANGTWDEPRGFWVLTCCFWRFLGGDFFISFLAQSFTPFSNCEGWSKFCFVHTKFFVLKIAHHRFHAAQDGHLNIVKCLVQAGADLEKAAEDGATPLIIAAQSEQLKTVSFLAEAKADLKLWQKISRCSC